jgi:hypothetical protein
MDLHRIDSSPFVSRLKLVTKILAGLPMVLLRSGALVRMMVLRTLLSEKNLTQRQLDSVYRLGRCCLFLLLT